MNFSEFKKSDECHKYLHEFHKLACGDQTAKGAIIALKYFGMRMFEAGQKQPPKQEVSDLCSCPPIFSTEKTYDMVATCKGCGRPVPYQY